MAAVAGIANVVAGVARNLGRGSVVFLRMAAGDREVKGGG
jgi:hypothetical protein